MKLLHLSSAFFVNKIYAQLVNEIYTQSSIEQVVYCQSAEGEISVPLIKSTTIISGKKKSIWERFQFVRGVQKNLYNIEKSIDLNSIDIQHAHFLYTDGAVAWNIKQKYGVPYIVSVRNTDVNLFLKYGYHLRDYGRKILNEAGLITFVTPSYVEELKIYVGVDFFEKIKTKIQIIPNGIPDFWFNNNVKYEKILEKVESLKVLYVGDFSRNKNLPWMILNFKKAFPNGLIGLVGSKGKDAGRIERLSKLFEGIRLYGRISDKTELRKAYQETDVLCVLSEKETFGLVYIEALSQGVPILYTKGQGVDGYFKKPVGYPVAYRNSDDFALKLGMVYRNYSELSKNAMIEVEKFRWSVIAQSYLKIYKKVCQKN